MFDFMRNDSKNEFFCDRPLRARLTCAIFDIKRFTLDIARQLLRRKHKHNSYQLKLFQRYTASQAQNIVRKSGLATTGNGKHTSWFYTAFLRQDNDPLTNYALSSIARKFHDSGQYLISSQLLVTGCGTGITVFHLEDVGFQVEGWDVLPEAIMVAEALKKEFRYSAYFKQVDCLNPPEDVLSLNESRFDVITVMHWFFSALAGNYGNRNILNPFDTVVRKQILSEFLQTYSRILKTDGYLVIELTDSVADYRLRGENPHMPIDNDYEIYPVRYSPEMVTECASNTGFLILDKKVALTYGGHQPRTSYLMKKVSM